MTIEEQRIQLEIQDLEIYGGLKGGQYSAASDELDILIGKELFSMRWILYYAQARNAEIACMYSSCVFADRQMANRELHRHCDFSRATDAKLLFLAHQYLVKHGGYKQPKQPLVNNNKNKGQTQ